MDMDNGYVDRNLFQNLAQLGKENLKIYFSLFIFIKSINYTSLFALCFNHLINPSNRSHLDSSI